MERISTGIATLDVILDGGIPEGAAVLIAGRPGSGKTILASQMSFHNAGPEKKVVYFTTLSEPQVKILRFQQEFDFFDLNKFQNTVIYQDLGAVLHKSGPAQALAVINKTLQEHRPHLIVVDTLKTVADMLTSFTDYREFLTDASLRMATWGCTALFLGEYTEAEIDIRPEGAICDGIIYLSGTEETQQQKRFLRILKMRGTDCFSGQSFFRITGSGINVFPRLKAVVIQVFKLTKHSISFVSDNIILLRFVEQGMNVRRFLRVVKMRAVAHSTELKEITIGPDGLKLAAIED